MDLLFEMGDFWQAEDNGEGQEAATPGLEANWGFGDLGGGHEEYWHDLDGHLHQGGFGSAQDDYYFPSRRSPSPIHAAYAQWMSPEHAHDRQPTPPRQTVPSIASLLSPVQTRQPPPASLPGRQTAFIANPVGPDYSNDWLDPDELRRPHPVPYLPPHIEQLQHRQPPESPAQHAPTSDYGDIDDLFSSDIEAMAPSRRTRRARNSIVDLTEDPSSPPRATTARSRKRSADDTNSASQPKRPKTETEVEELDLTNEAPSAEEELLQSQQRATIAAQQAALESSRPLRIGQRQCIICMEPYTNATVTSCGHIYCHECLTQALLAGEKNNERGEGNCPVCRKKVKRSAKGALVPVSFMTRAKFEAGV